MVERRRRLPSGSIESSFDEVRAELEDWLSSMIGEREPGRIIPAMGAGRSLPPAAFEDFTVDVAEHGDTVVVVADLPGVARENISIRLVDPGTLSIASERKREQEEAREGYYMRERTYGMMRRIIPLPSNVTDEGAIATFKNGVLELTLKKVPLQAETEIQIQ